MSHLSLQRAHFNAGNGTHGGGKIQLKLIISHSVIKLMRY